MMYWEFMDHLHDLGYKEEEIEHENYKKIEDVYVWYDVDRISKQGIAQLYMVGGMKLINDLHPIAVRNRDEYYKFKMNITNSNSFLTMEGIR